MNASLTDARETLAPRRGDKDGLLPPLLVALTVVTGLVDAFSYLVLGHVFVADMTGNVVFFAFAVVGARKLAVPDLTTTVLTLTITGIAADSPLAGATGTRLARRLISVAAMLLGALAGALLVLHVHIVYPLVIALVLLAAVAITALAHASHPRTVT